MRRVVIESPLSGDFDRNQRYARLCLRDCAERGEAGFASHLLYTQCLDDRDPEHRRLGMEAGFAWGSCAALVAVYLDLGLSGGMVTGIARYTTRHGLPVEERRLPPHLMALLDAPERQATPGAAGERAHYEADPNEPEE